MTEQFGRVATLIIMPPDTDQGLDLSEMQFRFAIRQSDVQTPNSAVIRVHNVSRETSQKVQKEFTKVVLQAGYRDNFAIIFQGEIKQVRRGKSSAQDSYLDLLCADGDLAHNFAVIRQSLAAGTTYQDQFTALMKVMKERGVDTGYTDPLAGPVRVRGKVLYGMARDGLRTLADTVGMGWSIQNGKVQMVLRDGYIPNQEAVRINSRTGMIGIPEQTEDGIRVTALLNPMLKIGTLVELNEEDVNRTTNTNPQSPIPFDRYVGLQLLAPVAPGDGLYRLYVVEHEGDTRGNEWYSHLTCLAIDRTTGKIAKPAIAVP
jgi:hypothetical protein